MPSPWKGAIVALLSGAAACTDMSGGGAMFAPSGAYADFTEYAGPHEHSPSDGRARPEPFLVDLRQGFDNRTQRVSDWMMDVGWLKADFSPHNVHFDASGMTLNVTRREGGPTSYVSAEFELEGFHGFGRFEVVMKTARMPGVVSSFFTHTGEQFGDPHSEIDFEFVGGRPDEVHTNYFWKGESDPVDIPLGFDASADFHLYAFEWRPDRIVWYVDGAEVRRVLAADANVPIPQAPGRVMANIWAANNQMLEWVGEPEGDGAHAVYRCMSHVPAGQAGPQCSDSFPVSR